MTFFKHIFSGYNHPPTRENAPMQVEPELIPINKKTDVKPLIGMLHTSEGTNSFKYHSSD